MLNRNALRLLIFTVIAFNNSNTIAQVMTESSCLTPIEIDILYSRMSKIKDMFKTDALFAEARAKERIRDALRDPAYECASRLGSIFTEIGARLDGCRDTILQFNNANTLANIANKELQQEQETMLRQIKIERSLFPVCR